MNCCDYDCNQGRNCPARTIRRVRAGQPVIEFTEEQIAQWEKDDLERQASADRADRLHFAGYIAAIMLCIAALAVWGQA